MESLPAAMYKHLDADGFRAIGLPLLLIFVLAFICYLFYQLTRDFALQWTRLSMVHAFVSGSSVVQAVLSLLFFFSSAWAHALINLFVSCFVILAVLMKEPNLTRNTFYALIFLNVVLLAGLPTPGMSYGILMQIRDVCPSWYNTYADTMCVTGWLTALQFFATLTIAAQFANCFVFVTFLLGNNPAPFSPAASTPADPQAPHPVLHYEGGGYDSIGKETHAHGHPPAHAPVPGQNPAYQPPAQAGYHPAPIAYHAPGQPGYQSGM